MELVNIPRGPFVAVLLRVAVGKLRVYLRFQFEAIDQVPRWENEESCLMDRKHGTSRDRGCEKSSWSFAEIPRCARDTSLALSRQGLASRSAKQCSIEFSSPKNSSQPLGNFFEGFILRPSSQLDYIGINLDCANSVRHL